MRQNTYSGPFIVATSIFFIHLLSLPPKWATLHISGLLLVLATLYARRDVWRSEAMRSYLVITCAWLIPFVMAAIWQNTAGLDAATTWPELAKLVLRVLGVGVGILVLLHRGWLTLRAVTIAVLCVLAINVVAGFTEWAFSGNEIEDGWRAFRMQGMVFNPNPFGTLMALCVVLAAGLLRGKAGSIFLWSLLLLVTTAVWASGSRGAILAALVGLAVLFLPHNRKGLAIFLGSVSLLLVAMVLYTYSDYKYSEGDALRAQTAVFSIEKILESPLYGWGKHGFSALPGRPDVNSPHNMLLDLALAGGLFVLLMWLASMAWLSSALVRKKDEASRVVLALLMTVVSAGVLEYSLLDSTHFRGIWVLITALACWVLASPDDRKPQGNGVAS
ncbi:MAG: O-antigen ligase family protein [Gammaproteobacteria bacterium]